jgi:hypothetical protein
VLVGDEALAEQRVVGADAAMFGHFGRSLERGPADPEWLEEGDFDWDSVRRLRGAGRGQA